MSVPTRSGLQGRGQRLHAQRAGEEARIPITERPGGDQESMYRRCKQKLEDVGVLKLAIEEELRYN